MYTNVDDTLEFIKNLVEIDTNIFDETLLNWLELSKGLQYRPFIVATYYMNVKPPRNGLIKTTGNDGAEWTDYKNLIKSYLLTQKTMDCDDGTIDKCWTVEYIYEALTGKALPITTPVVTLPSFFVV